jgi:hypothetical protein
MTETELKMELSFESPLNISNSNHREYWDKVQILFMIPEFFFSKEGAMIAANSTLNQLIPPQFLSKEDAALTKSISDVLGNSTSVVIIGILLAQLVGK